MAAVLASLLVLFALAAHSNAALYCVCKGGATRSSLQKALNSACEAGADCSVILQKGACYDSNSLKKHCDYAVNSFFQLTWSCDFDGVATTSSTPPPTMSSDCDHQSAPGVVTGNGKRTFGIFALPPYYFGHGPEIEPESGTAFALSANGTFTSVLFCVAGGLLTLLWI